MIIKDYELDKVFNEKHSFQSYLIYGPNEGLVREQINKIKDRCLSTENFELVSLSGKDLDADNRILYNSAYTVSMFYERKLIIINSLKDKHCQQVELLISDQPEKVILLLQADSLSKTSKLRKFFEANELCFTLACYEDDIRSSIRTLDQFISKNQITLSKDVKNYILQLLSNDRMVTINELEKIKIYYDSNENIDLDTVKILLNDSSSNNLNKMNLMVMSGNTSKSSTIINKLLIEGINPVSLIRSLINYLNRIQSAKIEMKKGNTFDNAIKILKPPVFWKDKDSFQRHCTMWPIFAIEASLSKLLETEIICKLNSKLAKENCEKSILLIADSGKRYFRN